MKSVKTCILSATDLASALIRGSNGLKNNQGESDNGDL